MLTTAYHRDNKPDNVLLSEGHAVVADFGVAKAVSASSGSSSLTSLGVALGTPAYMAPEQAAADPHVDHRADIYAVGALAYALFCGRPPFTATSPQAMLAAHITRVPEPVLQHRRTVSPALDAAITPAVGPVRCAVRARRAGAELQAHGRAVRGQDDRKKAADYYGRFVDLYQHADPVLQPAVREVRERLGRLAQEPGT